MLTATPTNWLSWNYNVSGDGGPLCTLMYEAMREAGWFDLDGKHFAIHREPRWGDFVLSDDQGSEIARATKTSVVNRHFTVRIGDAAYELDAASLLSRSFTLRNERAQGGFEIGTVRAASFLSRSAEAVFPATMSEAEQTFLLWLALLMWRRQSNS